MRLPSGQPWWQNGMPQSMHRPAWRLRTAESPASYTSFQSMRRIGTGRRGGSSRSGTLMKPRGSATGHLQDAAPHDVAVGVEAFVERGLPRREDGGVVARENLH